jgi:hypothetical protein
LEISLFLSLKHLSFSKFWIVLKLPSLLRCCAEFIEVEGLGMGVLVKLKHGTPFAFCISREKFIPFPQEGRARVGCFLFNKNL